MKKKLLIALIALCTILFAFGAMSVSAAEIVKSGSCGTNLTWTMDDEGVLTINGIGDMYDYTTYSMGQYQPYANTPWKNYVGDIRKVIIKDGVSYIGNDSFYNCSNLTDVDIADSVTCIGKSAFSGCESLTDIVIPDGVSIIKTHAFSYCDNLKEVTLGAGVEKIERCAFLNSCNIETLTILGSVKSIGEGAFGDNWGNGINIKKLYTKDLVAYINTVSHLPRGNWDLYLNEELLTEVRIPDGVTTIPSGAFSGNKNIKSIVIPDSVQEIQSSAFSGCTGVTSVTLGNGIKLMGSSAFYNCTSIEEFYVTDITSYLNCEYGDKYSTPMYYATKMYVNEKRVTKVELPNTVTQIPQYAFYNCNSLTNIIISDSVTKIGQSAFEKCSVLAEVTIGNGVSVIELCTFSDCTKLSKVSLGKNVTTIGKDAFYNCSYLRGFQMPECLKSIGEYAFYSCRALTDIEIPNGVTSIGKCAFGFSGLTTITIPDSVQSIGDKAFYYCSSLSKAVVGKGINKIGISVFDSCYHLTEIVLPDTVKSIDTKAFSGCSDLTEIVIPQNVTEIDQGAFYNCTKLSTVYYNGYESEWEEIYIGDDNIYLIHANKIFFFYVTLMDAEGTEINTKKYITDSVLDISDIEEKFEHVIHIYTDENCNSEFELNTPITENLILQLRYIPNQYISKFVNYNGEVIWEGLIDYGAVITPPENPERERTQQYTYTFAGWDGFTDGLTQTNREMVFTATYDATVNQYTYKFLDDDDTVLKELKVDYGTIITPPENPADKDPYTFDYWVDYQDGMELIDDISFKAVYKYKTYHVTVVGLDQVYDIVYNDAFEIDTQIPEKEYVFAGYYTEENGKGIRVTDGNGNSFINYNFPEDIIIYPYFKHELLNKIKVNGEESTVIGSSNVIKKVYFATDKDASFLLCTIKYPEYITLKEIVAKDFKYVYSESKTINDGYVYQKLICQYTDNLESLPTNKKIAPFELVFDIPITVTPQNISIEITSDSMLIGDEDYLFDSIINGNLEIEINPTEFIEIVGKDEIILEDGNVTYSVFVYSIDGKKKEIAWTISDESVATVSKDGVLTPISAGTVTLTATTNDGSGVFAEKVITIKEFAKIATLKSNIGQWDKDFEPGLREYIIYVPENATSISFTPTFTSGTLQINDSLAINKRATTVKLLDDTNIIFVRSNATGYADSEYKITIVRYEGTKTTVLEDGKSFTITPINVETGKTIILALYDGEKFVEMQSAVYTGEAVPFTTTKTYTKAKVMVWDDFKTLKPVCSAEGLN